MCWVEVVQQIFDRMGQINGKQIQTQSGEYFSRQIQLYRWRADSAFNSHIPRVRFFSKKAILQRQQFQNLLQQQLTSFQYVDVRSISQLSLQSDCREEQQIMTFQGLIATLEAFQQSITLQESLYVLQTLLSGYQTIYIKLRGFYVSADCCFVNERGQVRAWINQNHTLNQFSKNCQETSEATAINQILRVCGTLNINQASFQHFSRQLQIFFNRDILHNLTFSATRRFINGYLFAHKLIIPTDLSQSLKREQKRVARPSVRRTNSNLSELFQPVQNSNSHFSTKANLLNRQLSQSQYSPLKSSSSLSSKKNDIKFSKVSQIEFYKPTLEAERKLYNFEFNNPDDKKSIKKSDQLIRRSVQQSISSTFSKKPNIPTCKASITPKNAVKTRVHLHSTAQESFFRHSKETNGLVISNIVSSNSAVNFLTSCNSKSRLQKRPNLKNVGFNYTESNKQSRNLSKIQTQAHSKQPSFDENSSSLFISPNIEQVQKGYFSRPIRSKIDTVSQSEQAEEDQSYIQHDISTLGQAYPSQMHLTVRQVGGLIQNSDLHICESKGSFLSIQRNSHTSEYRGQLLRMGRSAEIVAVPSNKRLEGYVRSNIEPHFMR